MALVVKHPFVSAVPDDPVAAAAGEVLTQSHWNATHTVTGVLDNANFPSTPPPGYGGAAGATGSTGPTGMTGATGADGGSSNVWLYKAKVTGTTGDPGAGFVIWSNATQISATTLRVSATTDNALDIEGFFGFVNVGDNLLVQQRNVSENYQKWSTSGLPVIVNPHTANAYANIPVTFVSSGGTGTTNFPGNTAILLAIVATGPAGAIGATGATGATGAGIGGATGVTGATGPSNLPQTSQSANYTTVLGDAGGHLLHPASDANARTFTIAANASVAYPLGTTITFVNETSQVLSIAINSDTLTLANSTTSGTRSLAQNGVATALKVTTTKWMVSGSGIS